MVAALLSLALAVPSGAQAPGLDAWGEAVLWPLARYAHDLAVGEELGRVGLLEADAASAVVLRVSVESALSGGYRVHNLDGRTAAVPFAAARAQEAAHAAALDAVLAKHATELRLPFSPAARDWLAALSAPLRLASGGRPEAVIADWRFFGFRRGGVVDLPGLGSRSRAQTLKMLRVLAAEGGAERSAEKPALEVLRRVWLEAQKSAHDTQYLLTGAQVRAAALSLYPDLLAWAEREPVREDERPWADLLAMAQAMRPLARGRPAELWMAIDADAARTLADACALLRRRGTPAPAGVPAPAAAGPRLFADVTSTANFVGANRDALDIVTSGAAVLDYDNDGLPDVMVGFAVARGGTLWKNLGGMRFREVTRELGLDPGGQRGAPADFDGDGWTDLLVLGDNESDTRLWRNAGGKRFVDVSAKAGLAAPRGIVETGLWFDADADGDLDLYLVYLGRTIDRVGPAADGGNGSPNVFYLNEGGRLREATSDSGLADGHWGWAAQAVDADGDGRDDVLLCNLWGPSRFFRGLGGGRFADATAAAGIGVKTLCRGAAAADVDGDGRTDLFLSAATMPQDLYRPFTGPESSLVDQSSFTHGYGGGETTWQEDVLYLGAGGGAFRAVSSTTLEGRTGMNWSPLVDDLDLDGKEDMYLVNGFYPDTLFFHDERKVLRFGRGDGTFAAAPAGHGADFLGTSRASLTADFDRDGCPDLLVTGLHGPRLLRGLCPAGRPSMRIRLGQPGANRDGVGARVEVTSAGRRRTLRWGPFGGGQVSSFWGERLVGLGPTGKAESVTVSWPGGPVESFGPFSVGDSAVLRRGAGRKAGDGRR